MEVRIVDTMLVAVTDTVHLNDTVYLSLPRETKLYGDSTYTAQVSGYRPELDWVKVYPQKTVVTRTISVGSRKRWGPRLAGWIGGIRRRRAGQARTVFGRGNILQHPEVVTEHSVISPLL